VPTRILAPPSGQKVGDEMAGYNVDAGILTFVISPSAS
jgi:hypothetical protein